MDAFKLLTSGFVYLADENIDTDQIIPARFLKVTSKKGLGEHAFSDWRYNEKGDELKSCPLNDEVAKISEILVAGDNFGCGSSREHAPWALMDYGFKAVISSSIADIFKNNALKNGLLPIEVSPQVLRELSDSSAKEITINLEKQYLLYGFGERVDFSVEPFAKQCLLNGLDTMDYILSKEKEITEFEEQRS